MTTITRPDSISDTRLEKYLVFLDQLRESGLTNMFGARPYIEQEFSELDSTQAAKVLVYWMQTFSERHKEDS